MSSTPAVRESGGSPVARLDSIIASDNGRAQLEPVLPPGVTFERFARIARTALMEDCARQSNPAKWVVNGDPASLLTALVKCASDGLVPDGRQAALVRRGEKVSYMPMVGGLRHIVGQYGWTVRAYAIYSADEFTHDVGLRPHHRPPHVGVDRGQVVGAWAEATHRDGRKEYLVIDAAELAKRRAMATTKDVWEKWPAQQAEKTAARDIAFELGLDEADRDRIARVVDAMPSTPAEVIDSMYGPAGSHEVGLQAPSLAAGEQSQETDGSQQTDGAEAANEPSAPSVPGDDFGEPDEPVITDEDIRLAALAADFKVAVTKKDSWVNGLTLAEVKDRGDDGLTFFRWALGDGLRSGDLKQAAQAYAKVHLPFLYAEAIGGQS